MEIQESSQKGQTQLKIVAASDTHGRNDQLWKLVTENQEGDIFIHAGDFTRYGREQHFQDFIKILSNLKFKHKIVIAGNHEVSLDSQMEQNHRLKKLEKYPCKYSRQQLIQMMKQNCIYLEHDYIQVEGLKIFASPFSKKYGRSAFQYEEKYEQLIWKDIPKVDILVTHCPPYKILDKADSGKHGGSKALRNKALEIKPKFHLFGHIHEGSGQLQLQGVKFINLAKRIVRILYSK